MFAAWAELNCAYVWHLKDLEQPDLLAARRSLELADSALRRLNLKSTLDLESPVSWQQYPDPHTLFFGFNDGVGLWATAYAFYGIFAYRRVCHPHTHTQQRPRQRSKKRKKSVDDIDADDEEEKEDEEDEEDEEDTVV
jgi:hypothetical protein